MNNKTIILGITASIAAYKSCEIVRCFTKNKAKVYPILTPKANEFIGALTLEALSGNEVLSESNSAANYFNGLKIAQRADLILIAPATANVIAHIANGFASNLLETLVLARDCPLLIAPAMNKCMWTNEITQENVNKLKKLGVNFVGPTEGDLACGEDGIGRLADIEEIIKVCAKELN